MAREDNIVWVRRESVTYEIKLNDVIQFCKSYNPEDIRRGYEKRYESPLSETPFNFGPYQRDHQVSLYNREVKLLRALADVGGGLAPRVFSEDKDTLQIYMEYIPHPTYFDKFVEAGSQEEQCRQLTRDLVTALSIVQTKCNKNLDYILSIVNAEGRKEPLRVRSLEEEVDRWEKHFFTIIYHYGEEVHRYWRQQGFQPQGKQPRELRKAIKMFFEEKGINLNSILNGFIERDRLLNDNETSFVHGDFRPQNVFYIPELPLFSGPLREVKICDFDKARLGSGNEDLVCALYNLFMYPLTEERERFCHSLAREHFKQAGIPAPESNERLAGLAGTNLKEIVRYFGVNCQMSPKELSSFMTGRKKSKKEFIRDKFMRSLYWFFNHYQFGGEGYRTTLLPALNKGQQASQQVSDLKTLFEASGVMNYIARELEQDRGKKKGKQALAG